MFNKLLAVGVVIAIILAVIGIQTPVAQAPLGSSDGTNFTALSVKTFAAGTTCGDSFGTCNGTTLTGFASIVGGALIGAAGAQAASTTLPYDVAVTNMTSAFGVVAQIATSTAMTGGGAVTGWLIVGAKASTTAGYVTIVLQNNTGASNIPVTAIGSNITIWGFK